MIRLVFWLLVAFVVVAAIRRLGSRSEAASRTPPMERMVACRICGLNVPESEAVPVPGREGAPRAWACCPEHARSAS